VQRLPEDLPGGAIRFNRDIAKRFTRHFFLRRSENLDYQGIKDLITRSLKVSEILKELKDRGACRISEAIPLNPSLEIKIPGEGLSELNHIFKHFQTFLRPYEA
jgi:hypothetical protein